MEWINEKENLERYINVEKKSYVEIGKIYGCTDNNIKKVAKKLGIEIQPRRIINSHETFNKKEIVVTKKEIIELTIPNVDIEFKNGKQVGEVGERITIGELSKFGIDILLPMSDNLPYDIVIVYQNKFYKCQIKTSTRKTQNNGICFNLVSSNWYSKTTHQYTQDEVDLFILCDLQNIFLFKFDELNNKSDIILQYSKPKNNQIAKIHFASDYIISKRRIEEVFVK